MLWADLARVHRPLPARLLVSEARLDACFADQAHNSTRSTTAQPRRARWLRT